MASERRQGYAYADLYVGMAFRSPGRTITDADLVAFAGLTGDYSELHTSDVYAKNSEFGRRVAHGMLGLAYAHGLMWARTGELRDTAIAFLGIGEWKFLQPIFIGDTIFVNYRIVELRDSKSRPTQAIATFDGLIDVAAFRTASTTLASQKDVREGRKRQQRDFEEQQYLSADIVETMASLPTLTSDVAATVAATKHKIAILRETAAHEKKPDKAIVLKRAVAQVYVDAMETGSNQIDQKQYILAKNYYVLAAEAMPDSPNPLRVLSLVQALDHNPKAALESLRQAKSRVTDMPHFIEWLQSEPAFAPLRNVDAWYEAFGVKEGDAEYVKPEDRVRIW